MNTIYWDETPPDVLNRMLHHIVFGRDPNQECHGHFEPDGWDAHYHYYRCPFCGFRTQVPANQRDLTEWYLAPHCYVPDYIGSFEGASLVFQSMRIDRETREQFHAELAAVLEVFPPLKQQADLISAFSLLYTLGREQFALVAIAALRTTGYKVLRVERKRRAA